MKELLKYLLVAVCNLVFVGCCTQPRVTQWEYKVDAPKHVALQVVSLAEQEAFLNSAGKDGWELFQKENGDRYTFRRPKK
jgi:hypothetical protein